ncbi:hypothetical protein LCGC14_1109380 [marine sediment metagenome]|uniref:Uncharacterized protein n=1 Tax=marine sediment metagenome TaxID=412755 RepID=A0A0F9MV78_9ZZZZ
MTLAFKIPGKPVACMRTRSTGKFHYTPKKYRDYLNTIKARFSFAYPHLPEPMTGPVSVDCVFVMPRPKNRPKWCDRDAWREGGELPGDHVRSDIDNLCKSICDGLNGLAYEDDRQIVKLTATKVMAAVGEDPAAHVTISGVEG